MLHLLSPFHFQEAHATELKDKELAWERVRSDSYRKERELQKNITNLSHDLNVLVNQNELLRAGQEQEIEDAKKAARREERLVVSSRLKAQRESVRELESALNDAVSAKQVNPSKFLTRCWYARTAPTLWVRRTARAP